MTKCTGLRLRTTSVLRAGRVRRPRSVQPSRGRLSRRQQRFSTERTMTKKRILISGGGSGFGELAAIGLAQAGHNAIVGAQIWPQVTQLRLKVEALGLKNLRVEKLDI